MNEFDGSKKNFIGYEYKEITADEDQISFLLDGYENFGWKLDENISMKREHSYAPQIPLHKATLHLKRDRKIVNKMELTRLQRHFEACTKEIEELERSKTTKSTIYALIVGTIGTAFMAGSVFAITAQPPQILLCILLAVPAFPGWIFPYFIYRKTLRKETARITPLIEAKYDEIYEICEKGNKLLY